MKLSQMNTDKAFDVIADITPVIGKITKDEAFQKIIKKSEGQRKSLQGVDLFLNGIPIFLKKYKEDTYYILSKLTDQSVEEIGKQNFFKTAKQIKDLVQDEDLMAFFK